MVMPDTHRSETYQDSVLVETTVIVEDPPETFTTTITDAGGGVIEQRTSTPEEVAGMVKKQVRLARRETERAVRNLNRGSVTSSPGVQNAIMALRDLLLEVAVTSDD